MKVQRAYSLIDVKAVKEDPENWVISGMATTPKPDRVNDIVEPLGAQFAAEIPLLWQHRSDKPVGVAMLGKPTRKGIPFTARLPVVKEPGALRSRVEEAVQSIQYRLVAAVSIGFRALEEGMEFMENGGIRFLKTEILELSLVTIPANMDATIASVKALDIGAGGASARSSVGVTRSVVKLSGVSGEDSNSIIRAREGKQMKVSEQIAAFEAKRAASASRMEEIMTKAAEEGRTLDEQEQEDYDTLSAEVEGVDKHLVRLHQLEKSQAAKAKPVGEPRTVADASRVRDTQPLITVNDRLEKGIEFARFARCLLISRGDPLRALEVAKAHFSENPRVVNCLKAAVAGGTTTDSTWAAPLVDYTTLAGEFIDFLRPQTIIGKFGANGIPSLRRIPFNVRMGRQTSGGSGYWVGQGKAKPLTKFDFDEVTLRWAKVANIAVLTDDLVRFSNPSADFLVRQALADALRERMDVDFVDPDKAEVANVSPASITNGLVGITASGTDADAVRADIQAIMATFIAANLTPTTGVWIMSSTNALALSLMQNALGQPSFPGITMNGGTLAGLPVITTEYMTQVADSSGSPIILVNADDVFLADDGGITIDASREASLQMDDSPTGDSGAGTGTTVVSMFQTNSIALRAERMINWKKRRAAAVAMIVAAQYSASA